MCKSNSESKKFEIAEKIFREYISEIKQGQKVAKQMYDQGKVEDESGYFKLMIEYNARIEALETFSFRTRNEITKMNNAKAGYKYTTPSTAFLQEPKECTRCHNTELKYFGPSDAQLNPMMKCLGCGYNMSCPKRMKCVS